MCVPISFPCTSVAAARRGKRIMLREKEKAPVEKPQVEKPQVI
jgi:hypothetical protein